MIALSTLLNTTSENNAHDAVYRASRVAVSPLVSDLRSWVPTVGLMETDASDEELHLVPTIYSGRRWSNGQY